MKKLLVGILGFILLFSLAACSSSNSDSGKKEESKQTSESKTQEKVLNYYMSLVDTITADNGDYSAYVAQAGADPAPSADELKQLAAAGSTSAEKVSETLANEKVPDIGKSTKDFQKAVKDLSDAYKQEADALKADQPDTTAADEAMQKASDEIAKILEDNGLAGSDIITDTM
ncbi:hypothetical protein [Listeria ilorinensis]|uniref:hypothetical protein n=1 Tax=Listeria ilorinensis TaxID=2867439 RepID=UPI001EF5E942|nr:hypothetical protein [Listeria ilorinensis]